MHKKADIPGGPYAYSVLQNLQDAGCGEDVIQKFMALQRQKDEGQQLQLLYRHRKQLLEQLHQQQKRIDCLDYLLYSMQSK